MQNPAVDRYADRIMKTVPKIRVENSGSEETDTDDDDEGWHSASSTTSVFEASEKRSVCAHYAGAIGRLVVFSKGIRYVRSVPAKKEPWQHDFLELAEMMKVEGSAMSKVVSSPDQLEIKLTHESKLRIEGMKERDEAFSTIIAFSSL